jgi:hypothetical protein
MSRLPALRRVVRPIYEEMGIIPSAREMAAAVTAEEMRQ